MLHACEWLETQGYEVTRVPVDGQGLVDMDALRAAIRSDTILISVILANNEVGTIQPVGEIARLAAEHGIVCHTDAVQAIGKMPVRVDDLGVQMLSLTAHKFGGLRGWARWWYGGICRCRPCFTVGDRSVACDRARRMWPASWGWPRP